MKNIFIVIVLILTSAIVNTATAESIQFVPGLDGATKMITPWGDYLAIQNGNEIWVGTEKEYMDNKADAISAEHGFKPVMLNGQRTYISAPMHFLRLLGKLKFIKFQQLLCLA